VPKLHIANRSDLNPPRSCDCSASYSADREESVRIAIYLEAKHGANRARTSASSKSFSGGIGRILNGGGSVGLPRRQDG
jgi:hypothetical protein